MVSKADDILRVLRDHDWHNGAEFLDGRHGFRCSSYSQRITQLVARGHRIERAGRGGRQLGRYRLIAEREGWESTR